MGDVENTFLLGRDVLRFLWVTDVNQPHQEIIVMRFTRVIFRVSASPFLLNATIDHHMGKVELTDRHFLDKLYRSIYVDDIATGCADVETAYEFYTMAKLHLAQASFNLRATLQNCDVESKRMNGSCTRTTHS